jgi:hypothetical protein
MYCQDHNKAVDMLSLMGYENWSHDEAYLVGIGDFHGLNMNGTMSFCYDFIGGGQELEIVTYDGNSHHHREGRGSFLSNPFISHMSAHVENSYEMALKYSKRLNVDIIHTFETYNHVNPAIAGKKRFREAIIGTRYLIGYDVKFIERILEGPWEVEKT